MLSGICVGTDNLALAGEFYDQVLDTIGMFRMVENDIEIGFDSEQKKSFGAEPEQFASPSFWVLKPFNGKPASFGNGSQVMFEASSKAEVNQFHSVAVGLGGADEGAPGPRDYRPGYYGAYCRDLDGNKLHIFCIDEQ